MNATIELKLFTTFGIHSPDNASQFPISSGITIHQLTSLLPNKTGHAKLIVVNGKLAGLHTRLFGDERGGILPPVGGG